MRLLIRCLGRIGICQVRAIHCVLEVPQSAEVHGESADFLGPRAKDSDRREDPRNAFIKWEAIPTAAGYNILWGISKDKLY